MKTAEVRKASVYHTDRFGQILYALNWQDADWLAIDQYPWNTDYRPESRAGLLYDQDHLYGAMITRGQDEKQPRIKHRRFQGAVSKDSCLEFFGSVVGWEDSSEARPRDYFNLEANALPAVHLKYHILEEEEGGPEGSLPPSYTYTKGSWRKSELPPSFQLVSIVPTEIALPYGFDWGILFALPLSLLQSTFKDCPDQLESGMQLWGNFYKCGESVVHPHWGSWSPIDRKEPAFHCPECFGLLRLV